MEWPFVPNYIKNAIESDVLETLVSGFKVGLKREVVIVCASTLENADFSKQHIVDRSTDPTIFWSPFCKKLRSNDMLGFEYCKKPELSNIQYQWLNHIKKSNFSLLKYKCDFGFSNFLKPILVNNSTPIGVFLVGQFFVSQGDRLQGLKKIDSLQLEESKRVILKSLIENEYILTDSEINSLMEMFNSKYLFLSKYINESLEINRLSHDSSIIDEIGKDASEFVGDNIEGLNKKMESLLKKIKNYCNFESITAYMSQPESDHNILRYIISDSGKDSELIKSHYNWRKGAIRSEPGNHAFVNIDRFLIERGMKNLPPNQLSKMAGFIAYAMGSGPKALIIAYGNKNKVNLQSYQSFFKDLALKVVHSLLSDMQGIALDNLIKAFISKAKTDSHHMKDALSNSFFTIGLARRRVEKEDGDKWLRERLAIIESDVRNAKTLTERSLAWERVTVKEFSMKKTSIREVIEKSVENKLPYAQFRNVKIEIRDSVKNLPEIMMDKDKMQMAINCILDNAVKYSHKDKTVYIDAKADYYNVEVQIIDFGLGISEEDKSHIMDFEFFAKTRGQSEKEPAHGIGLHFAADVIWSHEGEISFSQITGEREADSSELQGYCVTFKIVLPKDQKS